MDLVNPTPTEEQLVGVRRRKQKPKRRYKLLVLYLQKVESLLLTVQQKPFDNQVSTFAPVYGTRLSAALHLASLAIGISQAGIAGCKVPTRLRSSLNATQQGLSMSDMVRINQDFGQGKVGLQQTISEANQVQPDDLQCGAQAGIATFSGGHLRTAHITGVDLLDRPFQYLLQRQAGIQRTLALRVILPPCATMTNKRGGLIFSAQQTETLAQSLIQDLNVGVDYFDKPLLTIINDVPCRL